MEYVKQARKSAGMTLETASKIIGVSVPTLCKWEREPSNYRLGAFIALMREMDDESRRIMLKQLDDGCKE